MFLFSVGIRENSRSIVLHTFQLYCRLMMKFIITFLVLLFEERGVGCGSSMHMRAGKEKQCFSF